MRSVRGTTRAAGLAGLLAAALLAAGCTGGGILGEEAKPPVVTITPADGTAEARPEDGVTVTAQDGKLTSVKVQVTAKAADGGTAEPKDVEGALSDDGVTWKAARSLVPDASYTVEAVAAGAKDKTTTATSAFTTLKPEVAWGLESNIPWSGQTVGVGMPIVITFSGAVTDKKAVESALRIKSDEPVEGAWYWYTDKQVIFRGEEYWKAHQKVKVIGSLAGVKAAKGAYGTKDFEINFKVGTANLSTVNARTHRMVVEIDGKKVRDVGISAGNATEYKYTTTNGVHVTMDKKNPETMISPGIEPGQPGYYKEIVPHAVRISYSGEYVHSAPWSVGSQGNANVSHGCINAPPEFAEWYYNQSKWGDIVTVTGTNRELEYDNGYGYWQKPWKDWVLGSAFDAPVVTDGSVPGAASATPSTDTPAESTTS
ncbi:Ig-like domain-containing protein [Actinocorallia sp. API 0066]|uniref:L,D-transpeptidase n=1 Tax=Actinocorallia sp. API 0066 TaxID=2896846 RepID=UPI001E430A99|nr:Ig-like domain-containing protein [Actinocorallia sp. API 0066]MCD0453389.1 Ig-like domain-containing protein [Actinocorallia sp. API 0066]